ncbi:Unknown protein sequence [Pseudomonas coronafaciens pv. oryzae]|nr:Unknown protein sequence [Pseudomonas coronafaciens pv. oryzae]
MVSEIRGAKNQGVVQTLVVFLPLTSQAPQGADLKFASGDT